MVLINWMNRSIKFISLNYFDYLLSYPIFCFSFVKRFSIDLKS